MLDFHTGTEGLYPSEEKPRILGTGYGTERDLYLFQSFAQFAASGDGEAGDDVAVAPEELCGTVDYNITAELKRPLEKRCHECIVDDCREPPFLAQCRNEPEVCNLEERI